MHRDRREALLSTSGVTILLVGVPILLLCTRVTPPISAIGLVLHHPRSWAHLLEKRLPEGTVLTLLAVVAWFAWAWLVLCVTAQTIATVRGMTVRLPGSRYAQPLAAFLVGASMALLPTAKNVPQLRLEAVDAIATHPFGVGAGSTPNSLQSDVYDMSSMLLGKKVTTVDEVTTSASQAIHTYVVQSGDSLWSIAERELGSPLRWREIATLNLGRAQLDGKALTDAHWIFPGWILVLPGPPQYPTSLPSAVPTLSPRPVTRSVPMSASDSQTQRVEIDGVLASQSRDLGIRHSLPSRSTGARHSHSPLEPIGFGILGASVVALLERMRRVQQRHRATGLRVSLPDEDLATLEQRFRLAADHQATEWIDLAQRLIAARVRHLVPTSDQVPDPIPRVIAVKVRADELELVLDRSSPIGQPFPPFEAFGAGSWVLHREPESLQLLEHDLRVRGGDPAIPALVTMGKGEGVTLLIDIERAGSIGISGTKAEHVAFAMMLELATSKWSDQVDLVLIGIEDEIEALDRVSRASNIAGVVQRLERRIKERRALLDIVRHATNQESRCIEGGDAWDLCVVFCMESAALAEPEALDELAALAGDGTAGLAIVACTSEGSKMRTRIRADGGPVSFGTGSISEAVASPRPLWPQCVDREVLGGVASLVKVAEDLDGVRPEDSLLRRDDFQGEDASSADTPVGVEIKILGPIEVVGAARPFTRAWSLDLVVYLAMHRRNPVETEKWATALWPDRIMAPASLHSTASAARRALGTTPEGDDHLPRSHGRLALAPSVTTDFERFLKLSRSDDFASWRSALELVRGRPLDGLRSGDWALLEGITALVEAEIVDTSTRYAEVCIQNHPAEAEWAARKGLLVSQYDERLYRILLRAADAAGNPAGIEGVMAELTHLVADDLEPLDAVHPETLALYRSLSRRSLTAHARRMPNR